jgi:hypothetical protein
MIAPQPVGGGEACRAVLNLLATEAPLRCTKWRSTFRASSGSSCFVGRAAAGRCSNGGATISVAPKPVKTAAAAAESQVRTGLHAGGRWIRTFGPALTKGSAVRCPREIPSDRLGLVLSSGPLARRRWLRASAPRARVLCFLCFSSASDVGSLWLAPIRSEPTRESAVHREGPHYRRARRHGISALLGHRYPTSWTKHERARLAGSHCASDGCPSQGRRLTPLEGAKSRRLPGLSRTAAVDPLRA